MKKGMITAGLLIILILSVIATTACGGTPSLIGKWQHSHDAVYFEFFSDGRVEIVSSTGVLHGTYEETGENEVTLTPAGETADAEDLIVMEYRISGDELTLTFQDEPEKFIRVKE